MVGPLVGTPRRVAATLGLPERVHVCLFDLDGVLTDTASVHRKAWKQMFDAYLKARADSSGDPFVPFDIDADYQKYVDGKKREDGVRSFLDSRGITLDRRGIEELGNRKNELFQRRCETTASKSSRGPAATSRQSPQPGSASRSCRRAPTHARCSRSPASRYYVQVRVDGETMREENIAGKPAPDSFLRAAQLLDASADEAVVFEDALAGVAAGRAGDFGLVVGVDRTDQADELRRNGADVVVSDLAELLDS